jgi:hypothetical protein
MSASRIEARQAEEQSARFTSEGALAKVRLRFLLGMPTNEASFNLIASAPDSPSDARLYRSIVTSALTISPQQAGGQIDVLIKQALAAPGFASSRACDRSSRQTREVGALENLFPVRNPRC